MRITWPLRSPAPWTLARIFSTFRLRQSSVSMDQVITLRPVVYFTALFMDP